MKRGNKVIEDNWDHVVVDVSTLRYPDARILIDVKDWEYLKNLDSLGRIHATGWGDHSKPYPAVKLRGKAHSLIFVLFRSPRAVQCITDNWFDLRRSNLHVGDLQGADFKLPGEEGFKPMKPVRRKRPKAKHARALNDILEESASELVLDIHPICARPKRGGRLCP